MGPARVSPWPEPASHARLVTRGPYARIRHPMYASLLLAGVGMAAHTISLPRAIALLALVPVLCAKMAIEEQAMRARFPEYAAYEKRTRRILPFLF
jgi:protein-S-isoprenylcysteine O-methyltransferase Ste14